MTDSREEGAWRPLTTEAVRIVAVPDADTWLIDMGEVVPGEDTGVVMTVDDYESDEGIEVMLTRNDERWWFGLSDLEPYSGR